MSTGLIYQENINRVINTSIYPNEVTEPECFKKINGHQDKTQTMYQGENIRLMILDSSLYLNARKQYLLHSWGICTPVIFT